MAAEKRTRRDGEPEEWEHPLFMSNLPQGDHPEKDTLEALSQLIYEDKTPEQLAEHFKQQARGNEMVKAGPKYYKDALIYYTQALDQKSSIKENNSIYYSNRAAVQLMLGNHNYVVVDCMQAIECNPRNIKAYIRAAKACNALERWEEAVEFCKGGLAEEPSNKDLATQFKRAEEIKAQIEERERKKREVEEKRKKQEERLLTLLEKRGIQMGAPSFNTQAYTTHDEGSSLLNAVFVGASGEISMSVLFIYEEYKQTDFVKEFNLEDTFIDHLAMMFPSFLYTPVAENGEALSIAPPSWDEKKDYLVENLQLYYETNWTQPLARSSGAKPKKGTKGKTKVKVDPRWTLQRVLSDSRYLVPGLPVFYVVPSRHEATFLRTDLCTPSTTT